MNIIARLAFVAMIGTGTAAAVMPATGCAPPPVTQDGWCYDGLAPGDQCYTVPGSQLPGAHDYDPPTHLECKTIIDKVVPPIETCRRVIGAG